MIYKLKILHLLWLSSFIFGLPITILLYFMIKGINDDICFTQKEIWGNQLLQPLSQLIVLIPQHQLLIDSTSDPLATTNLQNTVYKIDNAFDQLAAETAKLGKALQIEASDLKALKMENFLPSALLAQWKTLRDQMEDSYTETVFQKHLELTTNLYGLLRRIGDTSNLILDPDLDSYYMMDIALLALPQAQNRLGEIFWFGKSAFSSPPVSNENQLQFGVYASMLKESDLQRILRDAATSLREDKNFYGISPSLQENIPILLKNYEESGRKFIDLLEQLSHTEDINIRFTEFLKLGDNMRHAGSKLWKVVNKELNTLLVKRIESYQNKRFMYLLLSLAALFIASILIVLVSGIIRHRLAQVIVITKDIATGNLAKTVKVTSQDEIGQLMVAIQNMTENLNSLIIQIQRSGLQVASSATELAATAKQQKATMLNQVELTNQVENSVEDISKVSADLVHTMQQVATTSAEAAEFACHGQKHLVRMQEAMNSMEPASKTISGRLQAINEKTENITSVVMTIAKVADQTNLLSLNAAIEAEKAGEFGRGFNVVAREIRRLADQTAIATLDIEQMVKEMRSAVSAGVMEMDKFIAQVQHSAEDVNQTSVQLNRIIEQVQALSPRFDEVNVAMNHQLEYARQINLAMGEVSEGMRQTAGSLEESFSAIEQLNEAARGLQGQVSRFKVSEAKN